MHPRHVALNFDNDAIVYLDPGVTVCLCFRAQQVFFGNARPGDFLHKRCMEALSISYTL